MSVSIEQNLNINEEVSNPSSSTETNGDLDWKTLMVIALDGRSPERIQDERRFAQFTAKIRNLCPETSWLFINEDQKNYQTEKETLLLENWISKLVVEPEWPFPEKILIMSKTTDGKRSWKILIPGLVQKNLPYCTPPEGLTVVHHKDKYSTGWKITLEQTFQVTKEGIA